MNEKCDRFFRSYIEREITPCLTTAVARRGTKIYELAEGYSSLADHGRFPVNGKTSFNIGSVTKMVTAALMVKLIEDGELTFDDPVRKHIPEFLFPDVTIRHVATHTSGIQKVGVPWPKRGGIEKYFNKLYSNGVSDALPGEKPLYYSNCFSILMDIIQRVSGQSLETFARQYLFDPLGMADTTYDTSILRAGHYTIPCKADNTEFETKYDGLDVTGDSGLYSTAVDLVKFGSLFITGGQAGSVAVFSEAAIAYMHQDITGGRDARTPIAMMRQERNPHGCFGDLNSPQAFGHPGFSGCMLTVDPTYETAAAIVSNSQLLHADWRNYKIMNNVMMANLMN